LELGDNLYRSVGSFLLGFGDNFQQLLPSGLGDNFKGDILFFSGEGLVQEGWQICAACDAAISGEIGASVWSHAWGRFTAHAEMFSLLAPYDHADMFSLLAAYDKEVSA
jgi:hypothetical protein